MRVGSQKSGEKRRKKKTFTTEDTRSTMGREGRKEEKMWRVARRGEEKK